MAKTVLTVDDSTSMRMMIGFALREAGYEVIEAVDGVDAMEKLARNTVDMIVSDVNMPRMDGLALVRAVRGTKRHRFTPVLMVTTVYQDDIKEEWRLAGATGWIVKPFNPAELLSAVRRVMP